MYTSYNIKRLRNNACGSPSSRSKRKFDSFIVNNFSFNEFGYIRSDFSELMAMQSQQQLQAALSRVNQINAPSRDTSKMSFDELMSEVVPRAYQTPYELDLVEQAMINSQLAKYGELNESFKAKQAELQAKQSKLDSLLADPAKEPTTE